MTVRTQPLFTLTLTVAPAQPLGRTPAGERRVVAVLGGSFEGERLRGTVEPGGSDWIMVKPDGALHLDVRLVLKTQDGALVGMTYRGIRHGPAEIIERVNRGEAVDPSSYYFRAMVAFETGSQTYAWLNNIAAVATGSRRPEGPIYEVYEVL
ncbi:MAG TPA: DUF3237 domain-containing protein [Stellaceae bacterium]